MIELAANLFFQMSVETTKPQPQIGQHSTKRLLNQKKNLFKIR